MRSLFSITFIIAVSFMLFGCSQKIERYEYRDETKNAPDWVFEVENSPYEAVGSAKITPAGLNFAETEAIAAAKDKIARQVETKVYNTFKQFIQQSGVGDIVYIDKVTSDVSQQIATQALKNSKVMHRWVSKTEVMWVKVKIDDANVRQIVRSSLDSPSAQHQQLQSEKAQKALETAVDKNL